MVTILTLIDGKTIVSKSMMKVSLEDALLLPSQVLMMLKNQLMEEFSLKRART